ncbi:hypothetical protein B5M09_012207 [Aphanomyces astaci]|uniref:Peptidase M14 domain-containing protein n=1 Tax=Aphanomyces astaci TaxID=112090 RepID=A0A425DKM1_APHAT|nr:hypothetical protein B5M09_012207 [Aphanomyces astaci]
MKTIPILALALTAVTFAAADTTALAQGLDKDISTTVQNKTIYAYKLTGSFVKTRSLYFQSLLHAREWVSGSSNLYALASILDDIVQGRLSAADSYNLYFVPIVNIDGYDISWTKGKRLQRKNANEVDLNRNWPARFEHPKKDNDSSSQTYHGTGALTEPETTGIEKWLKKKNYEISGCVDVHSYAGKILYPNGDTKKPIGNDDDKKFEKLGSKVATAADADGKRYRSQTAGSFGVAIGAFDDYIYRTYQKPVVTIEIDGESFVAPTSSIRTHGEEIYRALTQFAEEVTPFEGGGDGIIFPDN